jgi:orotidine-5'-phosphate decarboxylase
VPTVAPKDRLYVALDVPTLDAARPYLEALSGEVGGFKVGLELFIAEGHAAVEAVRETGADCFLDLKLHDIPATVARAAARAAALGVRHLTVHSACGAEALSEAAKAVQGSGTSLLAVTVLTSLGAGDLQALGLRESVVQQVGRRASIAMDAGIPGLVCSAAECSMLRRDHPEAVLVVPGIRPAGTAVGDQKRVATPQEALRAGADHLVVGRPIRDAADPAAAARAIVEEIAAAVS